MTSQDDPPHNLPDNPPMIVIIISGCAYLYVFFGWAFMWLISGLVGYYYFNMSEEDARWTGFGIAFIAWIIAIIIAYITCPPGPSSGTDGF